MGRGGRVVPPRGRVGRRHPAHPGQDADDPLVDIHLATLGDLLGELALPFLVPGGEERVTRERPRSGHDRGRRPFHDPPQGVGGHGDERVPEVERDRRRSQPRIRLPRSSAPCHAVALDGQMSRNGQ